MADLCVPGQSLFHAFCLEVGDNHWTSDVSACCVAYKLADGKEMRFVAWT